MTTFSFEIEQSEVAKLKTVLKVFGVKKLKIREGIKMSKEDFFKKLEKSRSGKGRILSIEEQEKLFDL